MSDRESGPVTVNTIARSVGVAACTVSSVLNGHAKRRRIHETTSQRIIDEARRLQYVPNNLARGLRSRKSCAMGVLLPDFTNNWADRVMKGIDPFCDSSRYLPLILTHRWDLKREEREINALIERRVDGIITVPLPGNEKVYESVLSRGMPLLFIGDTLSSMPQVSYVLWNSVAATERVIEHLITIGRRNIAFLSHDWHAFMTDRRSEAFERTIRKHKLQRRASWMEWVGGDTEAEVTRFIAKIMRNPGERPNALYANNDGLAFSAVAALRKLGLRIPEDVAVVGMGNLPRGDESGVGLTTTNEPVEEIGAFAAKQMLELIGSPSSAPLQRMLDGAELIVRRTTVGSKA